MLASARATSVRSTRTSGSVGPISIVDLRCDRRGPRGTDRRRRARAARDRPARSRAVGDEAKLENSDAICRSSRTWPRIDVDASFEHRAQRLAAIGVHAAQVLGRQLDRRQRILDLVRDLPRHLGPGLEPVRAFELLALRLELGGHAVERVDQPAQLVGRSHGDPRVEVAARDPPGRARQPAHRIGDALGHRQPDAGAEQDEEQRREVHAAIELVDLALDFVLPERERHGQDRVAPAGRGPGAAASMYGTPPMLSSLTKLGSRSSAMAR